MDYIKKHGLATGIIVAVVLLGGLFIYNNHQVGETQKKQQQTAAADEQKKQAEEKKATEAKKAEAEKAKSQDYSYTAGAGDNYTYLARQAVQAYAKANGVKLEKSQVIAAETKLAEKANWVAVNIGQTVTVTNVDLKAIVTEVAAFTADQKAAWDVYSPYVVL